MTSGFPHPDRDRWLRAIFSAQAVLKGGVVRRSIGWVEAEIGRDALIDAVRARGFHLFEAGGQFVIICNPGPVRLVC
ncbi:N-(5'-phosphoribosyl)anthranilate isomerase [Maribius pontilimi]|uniref:N-(5'-phosphoribosyl)anthranilate isomerase n=1 Tax=Palleronia pontilimi TaxID=1964209 RepID=A0A934IFS8_9RHOB|nr:N-(5'-phosphoribosyl)anthranilate isomerase [Palleronia pontilimi]MBJ3761981.1 N-(5'-phosphoribosyl)anthranilate isomerase [Palleronia pontilimi]